MRYLNYLLIALASALVAAYAALWLAKPAPLEPTTTIMPLQLTPTVDGLLLWGGWKTVEGYRAPGINTVEIRCERALSTCSEAYASILHHSEGEDLTAEVFTYHVTAWTEQRLEAVASKAMSECLDRLLVIHLPEQAATLKWRPAAGCDGDKGQAVLVGDPL